MAQMSVGGLDGLIDRMEKLGLDLEGELGDRMLQAGAEVARQGWVDGANEYGVRATGDMIRAIGYNKKPKNVNGLRTVYIYPQGEDKRRGVTHAAKAYYNQYKSNSPHRGWVDSVNQRISGPTLTAMENVLAKYLEEKGMK